MSRWSMRIGIDFYPSLSRWNWIVRKKQRRKRNSITLSHQSSSPEFRILKCKLVSISWVRRKSTRGKWRWRRRSRRGRWGRRRKDRLSRRLMRTRRPSWWGRSSGRSKKRKRNKARDPSPASTSSRRSSCQSPSRRWSSDILFIRLRYFIPVKAVIWSYNACLIHSLIWH